MTKMPGNPCSKDQETEYDMNPYESFMRNHLRHYGYYTGRNEGYRTNITVFEDWERTHGYDVSDNESETEYENQALKDENADNRFQDERTTQLVFSYHQGKMVPKLREPRNLYALTKEQGAQHAARWPSSIEVLPNRVSHIEYVPSEPEPFYELTGLEKTPMPLPEGEGRVVYYNPAPKDAYFIRSRVGGNRNGCVNRAVKLTGPDDTTLIFESRFEGGNLYKAVQVSEYEYELYLHYDLYTKKHTQWYYFRFQNTRTGVRYRFTIVNLMKPGSLYNQGMRPLLYSEYNAAHNKVGWKRWGEDIKYYKNNVRRTNVKGDKSYYSLTWTATFQRNNDIYYFAHCYPYSYSDLQRYLLNLQNDPVRNRFCKQRVLCRTLAGNLVYVLTITSPSINPQHAKSKRAVILTARVHPGETPASWMMKGFLDYLTGDSADAKLLRDTFVFKVIPMLNPDGVIVGNYRCSLAGRDLNRNYKSVLKDSFPSVCHCKVLIKKLMEEREVVVYCDLHGHSRKQNVFIYGCENRHDLAKRFRERIFPYILNKNAPTKFCFESCKFKVQKSKDGTGRVVMWQMGIMNSFTMEATFCGTSLGKQHHFSTKDYESLGYHFCDSLLDYCDPDNSKCAQILCHLEERVRQEILAHLRAVGSPIPDDGIVDLDEDYTSAVESSTSGSDSSVDDGLPVHLLAIAPKLQKKKKLKTRKERDKKRNASDKYSSEKRESPSAEKEGLTKKEDRTNTPKVIRYQHVTSKDSHSAGRLNYARHDASSSHSALNDKGIKKQSYPDLPLSELSPILENEGQPFQVFNEYNCSSDSLLNAEHKPDPEPEPDTALEPDLEPDLEPKPFFESEPEDFETESDRDSEPELDLAPPLYFDPEPGFESESDLTPPLFFDTEPGFEPKPETIPEHITKRESYRDIYPRIHYQTIEINVDCCEPKQSHVYYRFNRRMKKAEYLEALTNAYLKNGVLPQGENEVPTFRYTAGQRGWSSMPVSGNVEGLCPHHEKTFAAQYVANHLSDLQFADDHYEWGHTTKSAEEIPSSRGSSGQQQRSRSSTRQHVVALSAVQQRQQDLLQLQHQIRSSPVVLTNPSRPTTGRGSPIKTHPSPFDEQLDKEYTDFVKRGYSAKTRSSPSRPNSRCPSATQISYPQNIKYDQPEHPMPVQEQYRQQLQQLHHQQQQQQQQQAAKEEILSRASKHYGRSGSKASSVGDGYGQAGTNRYLKNSGRISRTGNYSVDSDIVHSEIMRSEREANHSAASTSDASVNDDDDVQQSLPKHASQSSVTMTTVSKTTMTTTDTNSQTGKYCTDGRTNRTSSKDQLHQTHEKMEPDKVKRSNILVTRSVDTHHSYTPSFNRGKDFNITKIISSESSSRIIPYHNTSTESYPERSMGSSHHFRRAEKAETLAQLAARRSNSTGGLKYLDSTSPERYDTIDEQYEDMMTHEPRSVASHSHYRHIKTPMVTEASTISLSLGDKVYSNYDRFASARKNNRPPLLRHHPKRY